MPVFDAPYGATLSIPDNLDDARGFRSGAAELTSLQFENLSCPESKVFQGGERVRVRIEARAIESLRSPIVAFVLNYMLGQALFGEKTLPFTSGAPVAVAAGQSIVAEFVFRMPMLPNGDYAVFASIADGDLHSNVQHHPLHDAAIVKVSSSKVGWGLVGVPFEQVSLKLRDE
jgi:lipopolysaccharide transport system ATP-binding protein